MLKPLLFLTVIVGFPAIIFPILASLLSKSNQGKARFRRVLTMIQYLFFIFGVIVLAGGNAFWGLSLIIQESASKFGDFHPITRILQRAFIPGVLLLFFVTAVVVPRTAIEHRFRNTRAGWLRYLVTTLPVTLLGIAQFIAIAVWYFYVERMVRSPFLRLLFLAGGITGILGIVQLLRRLLMRVLYRRKSILRKDDENLYRQIEDIFNTSPKSITVLITDKTRRAEAWVRPSSKPRIFLTSTLAAALSDREKIAVIGHEIARIKLHHIRKSNIVTVSLITLATWLLFGIFSDWIPAGPYRNLLFYSVVFFCYLVLVYAIPEILKRRWASSADINAASLMGDPAAIVSVIRKTYAINEGLMGAGKIIFPEISSRLDRRIKRVLNVFNQSAEQPTIAALEAYRNAESEDEATAAAIDAYRKAEELHRKKDT